MVWEQFEAAPRPSQSCVRSDYRFGGSTSELEHAVADALVSSRLTAGVAQRWREARDTSTDLDGKDKRFVADAFSSWGEHPDLRDDVVKGDVAEQKFLSVRECELTDPSVVLRPKRESLSSTSAGWDIIELHINDEPWFVLWEIKGTDEHPEARGREAARQVRARALPWLAKLSKLMEEELAQSHGENAAMFGARLHEIAWKNQDGYFVGVAVVADEASMPARTFEPFEDGYGEPPVERRLAAFIGVPQFPALRHGVIEWIFGPS